MLCGRSVQSIDNAFKLLSMNDLFREVELVY
jgi:hypothetical protein